MNVGSENPDAQFVQVENSEDLISICFLCLGSLIPFGIKTMYPADFMLALKP